MVLGSLLAYSGAGTVTLLLFLPSASFRHSRVALSVLLVGVFGLALFATAIIEFSVFQSRTAEFVDPGASGFFRFVRPLWLAVKFFHTGPLQALLIQGGPGTKTQLGDIWYGGASGWLKQLFEYNLIGSLMFICLLASGVRRSRCHGIVLAAVVFTYFFDADFLITWVCTIMIVLCTLHGPEAWHRRIDMPAGPLSTLAPAAG